jgi:hypothetical protein
MLFEVLSMFSLINQPATFSISEDPHGAKSVPFLKRFVWWSMDCSKVLFKAELARPLRTVPCTWILIGDPSSFGRQALVQASCVGVGPFSTPHTQTPHFPAGDNLG